MFQDGSERGPKNSSPTGTGARAYETTTPDTVERTVRRSARDSRLCRVTRRNAHATNSNVTPPSRDRPRTGRDVCGLSRRRKYQTTDARNAPVILNSAAQIHGLCPFTSERFHVLLNSLFKVLFNFPSRYLSAIGLVVVFSLRWSLPPA